MAASHAVAGPAPVMDTATVTPVVDHDWMPDAERAAAPVSFATVPLPAGATGSVVCVAVVLALRYSRHRHWVTLR